VKLETLERTEKKEAKVCPDPKENKYENFSKTNSNIQNSLLRVHQELLETMEPKVKSIDSETIMKL
jgi:DNA anti-recombination protein RmuC